MIDPFSIVNEDKNFLHRKSTSSQEIEPLSSLSGEAMKLVINERVRRIFLFILFIFIIFIFFRLFSLQILNGGQYLRMAKGNEVRMEELAANRGIIYDRYMAPLVKNVPKYSLYLLPDKLPVEIEERDVIIEKVKKIIGETEGFSQDLTGQHNPIILKENLTQDEKILFEVEKDSMPGVILETKNGREYIAGEGFSHLLGYTGKVSQEDLNKGYSLVEENGKTGVEQYYENWLRGIPGKKRIELMANNNVVTALESPIDGHSIVLTLDAGLQKVLSDSLKNWTKSSGGRGGAAVALQPQTGEILALVSYPFFDNNTFSRGISNDEYKAIISDPHNPLFFRALSGEYEPGSTIKPAIGLAALEEGVIDENTSFLSTGGVWAGSQHFADWKAGGHGITNLHKALAESINTFFYRISAQTDFFTGLGPDKIALYLKNFGLGIKTGIELPVESTGFVPTSMWKKEATGEPWYVGDSYNFGIGHGYLRLTPLQSALMTAAIATDGKMVSPKIVEKIFNSNEEKIIGGSKSWQLPFKKENFEMVKSGMREAVATGTARFLSGFPIEVAGKTGTVETGNNPTHSWFTCFAPYDNPQIVISIIVENGGEGSGPALRATKEALDWWYQNRYLTQ
jgi:penicillin-binding protein 2